MTILIEVAFPSVRQGPLPRLFKGERASGNTTFVGLRLYLDGIFTLFAPRREASCRLQT